MLRDLIWVLWNRNETFLILLTLCSLFPPNTRAVFEDFEAIDSFPSQDWDYHTCYYPNLVPGINDDGGNPGHCYVPGGAGHGKNTEIHHTSFRVNYAGGCDMGCDFFISQINTHYTDLGIGLPRIPIENGINLTYSLYVGLQSNAGTADFLAYIDSEKPEHRETIIIPGSFSPGIWYRVRAKVRPDLKVEFYLDQELMAISTLTIDTSYNNSAPVLHGFNARPVFADNYFVACSLSNMLALKLDMPAGHYYSGDAFYLNCRLIPLISSNVRGRLFVLLDLNGPMYFYPTWRQFGWSDLILENKDEWSVSMSVLDDTTEIILDTFEMPFFPFPINGNQFMAAFTDPDITCLVSETDTVEWGFGGEPP